MTKRYHVYAAYVLKESFNTLDQGWDDESSLQYIKDKSKGAHNTVLLDQNRNVVAILLSDKEADDLVVSAIGVLPSHMGNGYGRALWEEALLYAKDSKFYSIRLNSDPRTPAFDWYRRLGFKPTGWVEVQLMISDETT